MKSKQQQVVSFYLWKIREGLKMLSLILCMVACSRSVSRYCVLPWGLIRVDPHPHQFVERPFVIGANSPLKKTVQGGGGVRGRCNNWLGQALLAGLRTDSQMRPSIVKTARISLADVHLPRMKWLLSSQQKISSWFHSWNFNILQGQDPPSPARSPCPWFNSFGSQDERGCSGQAA